VVTGVAVEEGVAGEVEVRLVGEGIAVGMAALGVAEGVKAGVGLGFSRPVAGIVIASVVAEEIVAVITGAGLVSPQLQRARLKKLITKRRPARR
jgi:hypothetical protein